MKDISPAKIITAVMTTVLVIWFANLTERFTLKTHSGTPSIDNELLQAVNKMNKNCPCTIDSSTRLDNILVMGNKYIEYNYTLNVDGTTIDTNWFRKRMELFLVNNMRTLPSLRPFRDDEITMAHHYRDRNGKFIIEVMLTPEKYMGK